MTPAANTGPSAADYRVVLQALLPYVRSLVSGMDATIGAAETSMGVAADVLDALETAQGGISDESRVLRDQLGVMRTALIDERRAFDFAREGIQCLL